MRLMGITALKAFCAICMLTGVATSTAWAAEGRCLIVVKGHTYLKGACNISLETDGSFTVGVGEESRSKHFAYVALDPKPGTGRGYWNGVEADDHAHADLGPLKRRGACWSNAGAKVCAWR